MGGSGLKGVGGRKTMGALSRLDIGWRAGNRVDQPRLT